ncbi:DUF6000 family protein [Chitinophaga qingshengii]|uniref:Uncharacterized protein n=1 Tax=Chitinophaga qingshengii TaxID=1569794 RepID=A0ABR7THZ7_9BACT|nr:DUF6000 family protein [Chitinophaga qingshengii]MBC9930064.1 hypothetical protein [Chitinophaga qingshengii]
MNDLQNMAELHAAGAIIKHQSPFASLPSHENGFELPTSILQQWVKPYYMNVGSGNDEWIEPFHRVKSLITYDLTTLLLGDFNWRTRKVGAYFAAVNHYTDLVDVIGTHFLKSELCCVGSMYTLVLASFNNSQSVTYLDKYLHYYLKRPDLHFDQQSAMEASLYLDAINGTNLTSQHFPHWERLRQQWLHSFGLSLQYLEEQLAVIQHLRN